MIREDNDLMHMRIDYFVGKGYLSYESSTKEHALVPGVLLILLKMYSLAEQLSFPRISATFIGNVKKECPIIYATEEGEQKLYAILRSISNTLFWIAVPVYKNNISAFDILTKTNSVSRNIKGLSGATKRKTIKPPITIHIIVDNSAPFEYLKSEYIFDDIYSARMHINQLMRFVPTNRLEMYRRCVDVHNGVVRTDKLELIINRKPPKMRQVDNKNLPKYTISKGEQ